MKRPIDLNAYLYPKYEKSQTCTVSGLRPHKLPKKLDTDKLLAALEQSIRAAYADGYRNFLTGSAQGVDIWAGEIVVRLKDELPDIRLYLYMPYEGRPTTGRNTGGTSTLPCMRKQTMCGCWNTTTRRIVCTDATGP